MPRLTYTLFQTPQSLALTQNPEAQRQIDEIIEHKCKQLSKANSGTKGNAIHLEQWMKGQLGGDHQDPPETEPEIELWTQEMIRKRSEELKLLDEQVRRSESRCEEFILSDQEQSPSKSTTTESQVTTENVRSRSAPSTVSGDGTVEPSGARNRSCMQAVPQNMP